MKSQEKKLRVGIVGCGIIADIHARAMALTGNTQLDGAFSRNESNAMNFGRQFDVPWYTDWDDFIERCNPDAVAICTPNGTHLDYGRRAAVRGKHVIVEKPLEVSLDKGCELIHICREHNVYLAVIYQNRFIPGIQELRQKLTSGVIGDIFLADVSVKWFRSQDYYDSAAWRGSLELEGGGVLINQAIHTIDLLHWLVGPVRTVTAHTETRTHDRIEGEDNAVAIFTLAGGGIGTLRASTSVIPAQARKIELHGTRGTAIIDGDDVVIQTEAIQPDQNPAAEPTGADSPMQNFPLEPHRDQFAAIADAIANGRQPPVSGEDSLSSLALVVAIYQSAKTGKIIDLESMS